MKFVIVQTTCDSDRYGVADKLAKGIVESKLGACVQVSEVKSVYRWKEKIENADELLLSIKTTEKAVNELKEYILANHPYQTPEIVVIPIMGGSEEYLEWVENEVS